MIRSIASLLSSIKWRCARRCSLNCLPATALLAWLLLAMMCHGARLFLPFVNANHLIAGCWEVHGTPSSRWQMPPSCRREFKMLSLAWSPTQITMRDSICLFYGYFSSFSTMWVTVPPIWLVSGFGCFLKVSLSFNPRFESRIPLSSLSFIIIEHFNCQLNFIRVPEHRDL